MRKEKKKAFVAYIPFGFPRISATKNICLALQKAGVDAIELGVPFSDPLADGPIIQKATALALKKGANVENFFQSLKSLNKSLRIPVIVMSYYNPIFKFGLERFLRKLSGLKAPAAVIVDLPVEESRSYIKTARSLNVDTIFFVTPATSSARTKEIVRQSRGFIYYISVTGITGPRDLDCPPILRHIKSIKKITTLPVLVGFGIHSRQQVERISSFSDGVIIGSSIIRFIENNFTQKGFLKKLENYVRSLKG